LVFSSRSLDTPHGEVIVKTGGAGDPPVLYLHAEVTVAPDPLARALASHTSLICPVHPGFQGAQRPGWVETIRDVAEIYATALPQLVDSDRFVLAGSSLGGWMAAELALLMAHRVSRLVFIAPAGVFAPSAPPGDYWFATNDERAQMLFDDLSRMPEVGMEEYAANDETTARYAWNPRFCDPSLNERLRRLDVPALVVWGENDRLLPIGQAAEWLAALPQARLDVVPECGHFPAYEQPDAVLSLVGSFLGIGEPIAVPAGDDR
jgi:pimeloyl-ACP methyl ester carboxylesterase